MAGKPSGSTLYKDLLLASKEIKITLKLNFTIKIVINRKKKKTNKNLHQSKISLLFKPHIDPDRSTIAIADAI